MARILVLILLSVFLSACSQLTSVLNPSPTPDARATETQIAANIFATQTASVPSVTSTPIKTATPVSTITPSEPPIRWDEAHRYVGFTKTVCGLVVRSRVIDHSYNLDFGNYPGESQNEINARLIAGGGFSLIFLDQDLKNFQVTPDHYINKAICVTGKISSSSVGLLTGIPVSYMGVSNQDQIQVK